MELVITDFVSLLRPSALVAQRASDHVNGTLVVFCGNSERDKFTFILSSSRRERYVIKLEDINDLKSPVLGFWWYAPDELPDTGVSVGLQGVSYIPFKALWGYGTMHIMALTITDRELNEVATFKLQVLKRESVPPRTMDKWNAVYSEHIHRCERINAFINATNHVIQEHTQAVVEAREQRPWTSNAADFPTISTADLGKALHNTHIASLNLPRWAVLLDSTYRNADTKDGITVSVLSDLYECALQRLRVLFRYDYTRSSIEEDLEVMCEMAALPALSCAYRLDHQGDTWTDEWSCPLWQPSLRLAGIDCEDGSEMAWRILFALQAADAVPAPFAKFKAHLRRYTLLFCLGTLEMPDKSVVYHAYLMGLDKNWVASRINDTAFEPRSSGTAPPFLIESTNYTTSALSYKNESYKQRFTSQPWEPTNQNVLLKIPSEIIAEAAPYHFLVTALVPQWVYGDGVGDLFFCQRNNSRVLGVRVADVLNYSDNIIIKKGPEVTSGVLASIKTVLQESFPCVYPMPKFTPNRSSVPQASLCYYVRPAYEDMEQIRQDASKASVTERTLNSFGTKEFAVTK